MGHLIHFNSSVGGSHIFRKFEEKLTAYRKVKDKQILIFQLDNRGMLSQQNSDDSLFSSQQTSSIDAHSFWFLCTRMKIFI